MFQINLIKVYADLIRKLKDIFKIFVFLDLQSVCERIRIKLMVINRYIL